jgi:hypothetical protein
MGVLAPVSLLCEIIKKEFDISIFVGKPVYIYNYIPKYRRTNI